MRDDILRDSGEFCDLAAFQAKFSEFDPKSGHPAVYDNGDKTIIFQSVGCGKDCICFVSWTGNWGERIFTLTKD